MGGTKPAWLRVLDPGHRPPKYSAPDIMSLGRYHMEYFSHSNGQIHRGLKRASAVCFLMVPRVDEARLWQAVIQPLCEPLNLGSCRAFRCPTTPNYGAP